MKTSLILACAGKGARSGYQKNKLFFSSDDQTLLEKTLNTFIDSQLIDQIVISASKDDFEFIKTLVGQKATVVLGGLTRTESVKNALKEVNGDIVLIHDGARPFVTTKMIKDCIDTTNNFGSAIPVIPTPNTILKKDGSFVSEYLGKDELCSVQTPQGFKTNLIIDAYARAGESSFNDDGEVYLKHIGKLATYQGDPKNVKITYAQDFSLLDNRPQTRTGVGFDCHKLVENRKLILGGITIPHDKGLLGHSDADVLTHAVMDAILSALALRDIGYHFSDKDPKYKDADSMKLLEQVLVMIKEKGYRVQSVSATIMAEKPKLLPHIPTITENLANALNIKKDLVGIGATTLEGLGFVGREEGICAQASATLVLDDKK